MTTKKKVPKSVFPEGFCIVVDTRESDPLFIPPPKGLLVKRDTLVTGDYTLAGYESDIIVERKKLGDLYNSCGRGHEMFKARMVRMTAFPRRWLLIEVPRKEVAEGYAFSQVPWNVVRMTLASLNAKLFVPEIYTTNRADSQQWILDTFLAYFYHRSKDVREKTGVYTIQEVG